MTKEKLHELEQLQRRIEFVERDIRWLENLNPPKISITINDNEGDEYTIDNLPATLLAKVIDEIVYTRRATLIDLQQQFLNA